jgi:aminoglycoside 2'-N-acetyltransferase I
MDGTLAFRVVNAADMTADERQAVVRLCDEAYNEDFSDMYENLPGSVHVLGSLGDELVAHACWVTRWLESGDMLCTAYVEAVAVLPAYQGRGYGKQVMKAIASEIAKHPEFQLAALSPSDPAYYVPLGWELWRGPLSIRTDDGLIPTPDDEEVMIFRLPNTPDLDLNAPLSAEWRVGELW